MPADFTGTWNADLSRSKLLTPLAAITTIIQHSDPDLRQEMLIARADGTHDRSVFQCRTNGEERQPLLNGQPLRGSARWTGDELLIQIWAQVGPREMHLCDYWSLSADGTTLTMEHRDDDLAGQLTILIRVS